MDKLTTEAREELVPVASLQEFFRDSIDAAMAANGVVVDDHTAHYVVNLLTLFARSEAFYEPTPEGPAIRPLALMLADAMQAGSEERRNFSLQRLGDVSLFVAGFFADGMQRRPVDVDYYINMGGGAYNSLAVYVRGTFRGRAFADVFAELAAKFQELVDVLNEVRDSARANTDADVLRLYEVWLRTGSRRARRMLQAIGIDPMRQSWTKYEH